LKFKRNGVFLAALLVALLALIAAGCGGDDGGGAPEALPSSSCTAIEFEGDGDPDYIIASDLPLQGASRTQTLQINDAIRKELSDREYKAGDYAIGFQACDDATAQAGKWDSGKCSQNANAYAANDKLIGVIGTFNSGCAAIIIPVLNQAPDGGIPMISPANTYPCLTVNLPGGCDATEPDKYYPSGQRNYTRVAPADDYQGAAVAEFMKDQGVTKVYILNDKEAYGLGVATTTRKASEHLGIDVVGFEAWDPKAASYESLFRKIQGTGLGPNDGKVKLFAPDGFTTQQTITDAGPASKGMFMSVAGVPVDEFTGVAEEFATSFEQEYLDGKRIDPYAIYGAQSAQILLDAIENSDGTREDVITKMFETNVTDGLLGSFTFNDNGDPQDASGAVVGFTIYVATDKLETAEVISPNKAVVEAAGA
jgi:branched-chain amino acid transport system substrate-binding protein